MKIEEAKKIAQRAINSLNGIDDESVLNDGRDEGDIVQNRRFVASASVVDRIERELASIEIEGVGSEKLDAAWRNASGMNQHLLTVRMNRIIKYAGWILGL